MQRSDPWRILTLNSSKCAESRMDWHFGGLEYLILTINPYLSLKCQILAQNRQFPAKMLKQKVRVYQWYMCACFGWQCSSTAQGARSRVQMLVGSQPTLLPHLKTTDPALCDSETTFEVKIGQLARGWGTMWRPPRTACWNSFFPTQRTRFCSTFAAYIAVTNSCVQNGLVGK